MFTEVGRQVLIIDGAADAERAIAAMGLQPVEMTEAEIVAHLETEQRLAKAAEDAIEQVMAASPQKRVADTIKKAAEYLPLDANAKQLDHVANHIRSFTLTAADFLMRGDNHGLDRAITTFWNGVRDADKLATPKLPLIPTGENVFYNAGWSSEEQVGLRNILKKEGDRCTAIDADGATLASGKRVSKKAALDAYIAPAGGKMFAVGSFATVQAAIQRKRRE